MAFLVKFERLYAFYFRNVCKSVNEQIGGILLVTSLL